MDAHEIGKKIKEARLSKKMTQAEVVGTFITRNMLSQIESGNALPSMKTLTYLSEVLELPLSYLVAEDSIPINHVNESTPYATGTPLSAWKSLYHSGAYDELITSLEPLESKDLYYDEKAAILAKASYELALHCEQDEDLSNALYYARKAEFYAPLGFYANSALLANALRLSSGIAVKLADLL